MTITGYAAPGKGEFGEQWASLLSRRRAQAVAKFLFGGHPPSGMKLTVLGLGRTNRFGAKAKDRTTILRYQQAVNVGTKPISAES